MRVLHCQEVHKGAPLASEHVYGYQGAYIIVNTIFLVFIQMIYIYSNITFKIAVNLLSFLRTYNLRLRFHSIRAILSRDLKLLL